MTRWILACTGLAMVTAASAVAADIPRGEHPRPDLMRAAWQSINGVWEFTETDDDAAQFLGDAAYPDKITVPFCRESELSGLNRKGFVRNVWYRRAIEIPEAWQGKNVLIHIGACDWRAQVWVNDTPVGDHTGGSVAFSFDITKALKPGKNTVIIHAFDDTRSELQALGKQSPTPESHGCVYTRTTGIWQSVWLEAVGQSYVKSLRITPDPANKQVRLWVATEGAAQGLTIRAAARAEGAAVGEAEATVIGGQAEWVLPLSKITLWQPGKPFLYDLDLTLKSNGAAVDVVASYFGLRTVTIEGRAILINGTPVFQRLVLDQGFYPDGIWTAPSDDALKQDIELSMAAGFNGARLHQKVFEPRFHYWADKLGYLTWGEFPNWGMDCKNPVVNAPMINEWREILERDRNHASIIGWCPFNESIEEAAPLQNLVLDMTRAIDPSRPIIDSSGWHHGYPNPIVMDAHDYEQDPVKFKATWEEKCNADTLPAGAARPIPFFISEYGGIGWALDKNAWGYGNGPKTLEEFYARYEGLTNVLLDNRFMFGFCYTQLTNVEQEQNGIYTYDRKPKFDTARISAINQRMAAYEKQAPIATAAVECASNSPEGTPMSIEKSAFGILPDGRTADLYSLVNAKGVKATITNYGGIVTSLFVPDKNGRLTDVVLGYSTLDRYLAGSPYFGAIVGRYGNRIAKGKFTLDGQSYQLAVNNDPNSLHGGLKGFDKVLWDAEAVKRENAVGLKLHYLSPDGEEGYPGNLDMTITYWLTNENTLDIEYTAHTDKATPINLTNHTYFNLRGHDSGTILDHEVQINASRFTPIDSTLIPIGELRPVKGTPFDFTTATAIGARVNQDDEQLKYGLGYDHNWVLDKPAAGQLSQAARVHESESGRVMEVWTTEPGLQFYVGNFLDGTNIGKGDAVYQYRNGFCMETQHFPDSPNQPAFPSVILKPGDVYSHHTSYRFLTD